MAQPFDADRLRLSGEAAQVADQVSYGDRGRSIFSVSDAGVLGYSSESRNSRLVWYDRAGHELGQVGDPGEYVHISLSPDDSRVAIETGNPLGEDEAHDIWLMNLPSGRSTRFTFDADFEGFPIWSPDGRYVVYVARRADRYGIYRKPAGGTGEEELLLPTPERAFPSCFTPDGASLVFESSWGQPGPPDLWILPLTGTREPFPFERTPTWENSGIVSPDGRWIAHSERNDLYVESFPVPGGKWLVASGAGFPFWRRDGRELFYGSLKGGLIAVDVEAGPGFRVGTPRVVVQVTSIRLYKNRFPYAVTSDGQRILVNRLETAVPSVSVVVNWTASLGR
jgi:eukaryotic-like serine/threonine-protein kinase